MSITHSSLVLVTTGLILLSACGGRTGNGQQPPLLGGAASAGGAGAHLDSILSRDVYYTRLNQELESLSSGEKDSARSARIDQITANIRRYRAMPPSVPGDMIQVEIATQRLEVISDGEVILSMKIVAGLPEWPTPTFASAVDRIVINPTWLSPRHVLAAEILGYIKADSNYLRANVMTLLRWRKDSMIVVDPRSIDWSRMTPEKIDFAVRQEPGPGNIMGRIKFLADNPHAVFLHDTPYRDDFAKERRLASHGCIRLERAFDLAAWLLKREGGPDTLWLRRTLNGTREWTIRLRHPVPVRVEYRTVQFDQEGTARYSADVYGLDRQATVVLK